MGKSVRAFVRASALAALGLGALSYASGALACDTSLLNHPASWQDRQNGAGGLLHLASEDNPGNHAIVGMWSFVMTAGDATIDFGYQQWHSDGTELLNSGGRAPATENFCMGVWKQVGPSRYHLNHYALSYDSSGVLNAKVRIQEDVTTDPSAMTYTGSFTFDIYDPTTDALEQHLGGDVTAHRITAN